MSPSSFVGMTLGDLARKTGILWKPVRVFVLQSKEDDTGIRLMDAYSLKQVVQAHPYIAKASVVIAYEFYEELVLRVRF